jgi:hypothetical protein
MSVGDRKTRDGADSLLEASKITEEGSKDASRSANLHFTVDGVARGGRKTVRMFLHVLAACYCFWMLAVICDEYFVASIEVLCQSELKFGGI